MAKSFEDAHDSRHCSAIMAAVFVCLATATAWAQETWKPTRPVMLIAPNAAGGNSDRLAREMHGLLQAHRLVEVPIVVVNRPGGAGTIALNQLMSSPGDGHVLLIGTAGLLSNHITGLSQHNHTEVTTLVQLLEDYYGVNVRTNSPIQSRPRDAGAVSEESGRDGRRDDQRRRGELHVSSYRPQTRRRGGEAREDGDLRRRRSEHDGPARRPCRSPEHRDFRTWPSICSRARCACSSTPVRSARRGSSPMFRRGKRSVSI